MKLILIFISNLLIVNKLFAQDYDLNKIKWSEAKDTLNTKFKSGFYLCIEVPKGYESHGFNDILNKHHYVLSKKDYLPISYIDTVFQSYDKGFKIQVINIKLNNHDAKAFFDYSMKWKGLKIGLFLNNKFIYAATISAPIDNGNIVLGGYTEMELNEIEQAIKSFNH